MTGLISYGNTTPPAHLPVAKDYPAALVDDLPKNLLAQEVSALLHFMPDLRRKMLFTTLWNTGARISEALALTRGDFLLRQQYPFVQLATLKQREAKADLRAGRLPAGVVPHRQVQLSGAQYVNQPEMMIATLHL